MSRPDGTSLPHEAPHDLRSLPADVSRPVQSTEGKSAKLTQPLAISATLMEATFVRQEANTENKAFASEAQALGRHK